MFLCLSRLHPALKTGRGNSRSNIIRIHFYNASNSMVEVTVTRLFLICLLACSVLVAGCSTSQTAKDAWKYTKRQYYSYLNTPATIDMDDVGSSEDFQLALSEHIMEVDRRMELLIRKMENSDISPDQRWVVDMVSQFPWLSGVALVDENGQILSHYPAEPMKPFDATPLLDEDPKQNLTSLRSYLQETALGPEMYIGKPVYTDGAFRGLVVAHFDPSVLLQECPVDSSQIAIICPQGPIWTGSAVSGTLSSNDWSYELSKRSSGYYNDVYWTTRYFGNLPVVYGISTSATPTYSVKSTVVGNEISDENNIPAPGEHDESGATLEGEGA